MPLLPLLKRSSSLYSGSGNTFCVTTIAPHQLPIVELCLHYKLDGVICYDRDCMRIFNADGSEAQMCGNGLRCLIAFLWDHGDQRTEYLVDTKAGLHRGWYHSNQEVTIAFPPPSQIVQKKIDDTLFFLVNTGVPHAVFCGDLSILKKIGPKLVHHPIFGELGSNITYYECVDEQTVYVGTYERGVYQITQACGTGCLAVACVLQASKLFLIAPSGERLMTTLNPPTLTGRVEKKASLSILDLL